MITKVTTISHIKIPTATVGNPTHITAFQTEDAMDRWIDANMNGYRYSAGMMRDDEYTYYGPAKPGVYKINKVYWARNDVILYAYRFNTPRIVDTVPCIGWIIRSHAYNGIPYGIEQLSVETATPCSV